jgi:hypothetical protein
MNVPLYVMQYDRLDQVTVNALVNSCGATPGGIATTDEVFSLFCIHLLFFFDYTIQQTTIRLVSACLCVTL